MIPAPILSLPALLLLLAPAIAGLLSLWLVMHWMLWRRKARHAITTTSAFWTWPIVLLTALAVAGDIWGLVLGHELLLTKERIEQENHYRQQRQNFILPKDFQYGEQTFPKGTLINRYDPFDNGEPQRPLGLRGLSAARFPEPIRIAGAWVNAIDTHGELELARNQHLSPVYHFDPNVRPPYGDWVIDPSRPYLDCHTGDIVHYHAPLIDYDIEAEFTTGAPDGVLARFRPSQWGFTECTSDQAPIEVMPAYE